MNLLFAQLDPAERLRFPSTKHSPELYWVLLAIGVIVVGIIVWLVFFRKSPEEVSGWGPERSHYQPPKPSTETPSDSHHRHRRRRRRRRREHRPRNPTLAETGGLPPARPQESSHPEP